MVFVWFTFTLILYVGSEVFAAPVKITPQEKLLGLNGRMERSLSGETLQRTRVRRNAHLLSSDCSNGSKFRVEEVPYCHVKNAVYNSAMNLCMEELLHVPGMPDGDKGYNYLAHNHFLYRTYNRTNQYKIVMCPTSKPTTKPAPKLSTGKNTVSIIANTVQQHKSKTISTTKLPTRSYTGNQIATNNGSTHGPSQILTST